MHERYEVDGDESEREATRLADEWLAVGLTELRNARGGEMTDAEPAVTLASRRATLPGLVFREESDDGAILFDPDTAAVRILNLSATASWRLLDGQRTLSEVLMAPKVRFDGLDAAALNRSSLWRASLCASAWPAWRSRRRREPAHAHTTFGGPGDHQPVRRAALRIVRQGLPNGLGGVCGRCMLRAACLGACVAQRYYRNGGFLAGHRLCEEAEREGPFPEHRMMHNVRRRDVR